MTSTIDLPHAESAPVEFTGAALADLTPRERDILELVTNGYSNAEIGRMLHLSINSIKTYIRTSYRKIGAETRAHAIAWGVRHGLLPGVPGTA